MWANEFTASLEVPFKSVGTLHPAKPALTKCFAQSALPITILGVAFDHVTLHQTVRRIEEMINSRQPHYVATANVDFLVQSMYDVELHRILLDAHLVVCDGTPLIWTSRLLGNPLPERVAGSDLTPLLIRLAVGKKYRIFLLGATPTSNDKAVANLQAQYPDLIIAGHYAPPFRALMEMDHEEIRRQIHAAHPDILFVSLGCPKQEKWIGMHYRSLGVPVVIGVGAVVDFLAGYFKRAPRWMQLCGLEWVYRMSQEPRRLVKRYAADLWHFGLAISQQLFRLRARRRVEPSRTRAAFVMIEPEWQRITSPEHLNAATIRRDLEIWNQVGDRHCLIDVSEIESIDSTGIGLLTRLHHCLEMAGHSLILLAPSHKLRRVLKLMQLDHYFLVALDAVEARRIIVAREEKRALTVVMSPNERILLQGEITAANADEMWDLLKGTVHTLCTTNSRILIDLSDVTFIDSTGLGLLIKARKEAAALGATLHYADVTPDVRNVMKMARMEAFLLVEHE